MTIRISCYIIFLKLFFLLDLAAQEKIKWGVVTNMERELEECSYEPEASAVVLFHVGEMIIPRDETWKISHHIRFKVLKEEGIDKVANYFIKYYSKDHAESISKIKAQTINGDEITKLKKDDYYKVEVDDKYSQISLAFEKVKVGSILEVSYVQHSNRFFSPDPWYFQTNIPVLHSELSGIIDQSFNYNIQYNGNRLYQKYVNAGPVNKWSLSNLPSIKDVPHLFNRYDYVERIKFQLESYYKYGVNAFGEGSGQVNIMKGWDQLAKDPFLKSEFNKYLKENKLSREIFESIKLDPNDGVEEKIKKIHQYVVNQFTWNGDYRLFPEYDLKELYELRVGNSSDVNLLYLKLLSDIGIEAYPALVSTRSHGKLFKPYPFLAQFNCTVIAIRLDNKLIISDALSKFRTYNLPDYNFLNSEAFLIDKENLQWVPITTASSNNKVFIVNSNIENLPELVFSINIVYKEYAAEKARKVGLSDFNREIIENVSSKIEGIELDSISIQNFNDTYFPINITYHFKAKLNLNRQVYLPSFAIDLFEENPFKSNDRHLPIDMKYFYNYTYSHIVNLPKDKKINIDIPKNHAARIGRYGLFGFNYSLYDSTINMTGSVRLNSLVFYASEYQKLKEYFDTIVEKQKQIITISN